MLNLELNSKEKQIFSDSSLPELEKVRKKLVAANEHRDYSIYTRSMDAALEVKAHSMFPHFGDIREGSVIVDAGSGTGQMAELAMREFHGARVFALDISHELMERAEDERALTNLMFGDASDQNFPDNSIDVKYFSTSGHEIESFGGTGSMRKAVRNTFRELILEGELLFGTFANHPRKSLFIWKFFPLPGWITTQRSQKLGS